MSNNRNQVKLIVTNLNTGISFNLVGKKKGKHGGDGQQGGSAGKGAVAKPDDLSSVPALHGGKGELTSTCCSLTAHMRQGMCTSDTFAHTIIDTCSTFFKYQCSCMSSQHTAAKQKHGKTKS